MSFNTAIAKYVYFDNNNAPDIGDATKQLALSIEPTTRAPFATTAARDAAITSTVRNNAPLAGEGWSAYVDNVGGMEWDGTAWVAQGTRVVTTYTANSGQTAGAAANGGVTYVSGINGAAQFTLPRKRLIEVRADVVVRADTVGAQWRLHVYETAGDFIDHRENITVAGPQGAQWRQLVSKSPIPMPSGSHGIGCVLQLPPGAINGILGLDSLTITVLDVGPAL